MIEQNAAGYDIPPRRRAIKSIPVLLFLMFAGDAFADGFSPMELKQVLPKTDAILLVEIIQNAKSVTHKNKGKGSPKEAVVY